MASPSWNPEGEPKRIDGTVFQYLRPTHGHEGGHSLSLSDATELVVLPTPTTTTRGRSGNILMALETIRAHGIDEPYDQMAFLVGSLMLYGATNLIIDGDPLGDEGAGRAEWQVTLHRQGEVRIKHIGGRYGT